MTWICPTCGLSAPMRAEEYPVLCGRCQTLTETPQQSGKPGRRAKWKPGGPGTELMAIFKKLGIKPHDQRACQCAARATQMDAWGVAGCRQHRGTILAWLEEAYRSATWSETIWAGAKSLITRGPLSLAGLLEQAIGNAERKQLGSLDGIAALAPLWRHRFPSGELLLADHCLNPSIHQHAGKTYLAYRRGWGGGRIVLAELDEKTILWQRELKLPLRGRADKAHEDPRLFTFNGSLHVSYTGCTKRERVTVASVCYARLSDSGDVLADYQPAFAHAQPQEKNWSFFEHAGNLYAVYAIAGHRRILRIDGEQAELAHDYQQELPFAGGEPRGGASPVLHNGQWYAFFHGVAGDGTDRIYTAGLYTFDAEPPFRIRRFIRQPLLLPNVSERPVPTVPHCIYPAGALRQGNEWIVSLGYYDHYCELAGFDAAALEELLA